MQVVVEGRLDVDGQDLAKLLQAVEVHGYRGPSKKRHNGVVPIRPCDARLRRELARRLADHPELARGFPVKVVAHVDGTRLVGVILEGRLHVLGAAAY